MSMLTTSLLAVVVPVYLQSKDYPYFSKGFIVYQAQRYMSEPGIGLILLSLMDLAVIVLTVLEYRARRRRTA